VSKKEQEDALKNGVHVIVATPGRLIDFLNSNVCDLTAVGFLVLDEADRMLDMGFEPEIKKILSYVPSERQTAMFSATWPPAIQKLAQQYLKSPICVTIGSNEGKLVANSNITQIVEVVEPNARDSRLLNLLKDYHKSRTNRILIFVLYKKEAARLEIWLNQRGWNSASIHSDKNQKLRIEALNSFTSGKTPLLIATDVASRGLDIPQVEYVINYSFPLTIEDYVHRIGRTGRAGKTGISHTFFQKDADKAHAGELVNVLKETNQKIPDCLLQFDLAVKKKEPKLGKIDLQQPKSNHITFDSDSE
jgi:ATP-dependent RNA helicase DBP3